MANATDLMMAKHAGYDVEFVDKLPRSCATLATRFGRIRITEGIRERVRGSCETLNGTLIPRRGQTNKVQDILETHGRFVMSPRNTASRITVTEK